MNSIEAKYPTDIASPEAPTGLGIAGSETGLNPQELSQIAQNAENAGGIAFYGGVRDGIRKFADYTGRVGKQISPRNLVTLGSIGVIALSAACGGSDSKASTSAVDTATPTPIATGQTIGEIVTATVVSTPEVKVIPTITPTVVAIPKVEKTPYPEMSILDQPVGNVTIDQLRSEALNAYDSKPDSFKESSGAIWRKSSLEGNLKTCQDGSPDSVGNAKLIAQERLGSCAGIVRKMVVLYRNNGDPQLMKIAADARSYFISQYPELQFQFDSFLEQAGAK